MEVVVLFALILLNGLFAMSEIALVASRRARLAQLVEGGDRAAAVALKLSEEPTRFLSTIQIGITSIGILSGIFGEAALARPLSEQLQALGVTPRTSQIGATVLVVVTITYLSIVLGELLPKRVGQLHPETIARLVAPPLSVLAILSRPFVYLLAGSTSLLLRLLGQRDEAKSRVTEEEIHAMLDEGSEAGVIEKGEHEMLRNVFRLDERRIASLMVPRAAIVWLDVTRPLDENLGLIVASGHSRFPVCRGPDEILGVASASRLLGQTVGGAPLALERGLQEPVFVPETITGLELLGQLRASGADMVFVIDEYGELQGLITVHDLIAAVTGEFQLHGAEERRAVRREDGSWLLDGLIPLPEMKDRLGLKLAPEEGRGRYHTLSGMMMWLLGRLPAVGDVATWEGWRFEVVDLDGRRIDKVLASPLPPAPKPAGEAAGDD
jgi:putative hemolysin